MGKAMAVFKLSLVLVMSCFLALGHGEQIEALPPHPIHVPVALPPAPPPNHHPPAAAPAHPPHHHHHHHHPPPPPPPPAHPPVHPPSKPASPPPPPPKSYTPPPPLPKPHTPPPKPATPPPKPHTPPPKPATPPPKPHTPPPKPATPPPKPATPLPKPHTPPPKPATPPPKPYTPPPKPASPPPKPATPPPKPYTPPPKAPVNPPVIPKRSFIAVQGVVYCKSCKYAGKDTLLGATPVYNATVRLVCKNTKYKTVDTAKTDKNGYFLITASKTVTNYGVRKCRASLLWSPLKNCQRPSLLHGGRDGAILVLNHEKPNPPVKKSYLLYTVGPFAFEPKCPRA